MAGDHEGPFSRADYHGEGDCDPGKTSESTWRLP
jgi:hypothetical protein